MPSAKQSQAARRNIKKAAAVARGKRTIAHLPKSTRTALGKQGAKVRRRVSRSAQAPAGVGYSPTSLPESSASAQVRGGEVQHLIAGRDIPFQWWELFQSPALSSLIARAFRTNPTIAAAQAALAQAQEGGHGVDARQGAAKAGFVHLFPDRAGARAAGRCDRS